MPKTERYKHIKVKFALFMSVPCELLLMPCSENNCAGFQKQAQE